MPDRSWWPLVTALGLLGLCLGMLFHRSIDPSGELVRNYTPMQFWWSCYDFWHNYVGIGRPRWLPLVPQRRGKNNFFQPSVFYLTMSDASAHALDHHEPVTSTGIPNKKVLMWAFLGSDCMFFGTLISTHLIYEKFLPLSGEIFDIRDVFDIELTSFSTFILLASSLFMALAVSAIHKGNLNSTRWMLFGTIVFGLIFLACQVYEFTHFVHAP